MRIIYDVNKTALKIPAPRRPTVESRICKSHILCNNIIVTVYISKNYLIYSKYKIENVLKSTI